MSALLWTFASTFALFTTSRIIGGLSEGNVQLSIAMISDVTTARDRSRGLALVGIAFALGFTVGPALGAYVAAMDMRGLVGVQWMERVFGVEVNAFSAAAGLCLLLLTVETVFIAVAFEETSRVANGEARSAVSAKASVTSATTSSTTRRASPRLRGRVAGTTEDKDAAATTASTGTAVATTMATLSRAHFTYLFFFSGAEFALTFLTYDRFRFTNIQQGMLLGTVGILSALVQGAYVRRMAHRVGERRMLMQGMASCVVALSALAVVGTPYDYWWTAQATTSSAGEARRTFYSPLLLVIVIAFAFASATVVNGLNALASLRSGIEYDAGERGAVMGRFRSVGQLGRALGPVVGCAVYWLAGGVVCYAVCASGVAIALGGVLWAGATKERVKSEVKAGVVMKQVKPKASLKRE